MVVFRKRDLINFLFVTSFPLYGLGFYAARVTNYSAGMMVSISPLIAILLFFIIDAVLQRKIPRFVHQNYLFLLLFAVFSIYALFLGVRYGVPGRNFINTATLSFVVLITMHAAMVVQYYNIGHQAFSIGKLLYQGLTFLILVNLLGYGAGFNNPNMSFEGRLNLPFGPGLYFAAHTVAIINLLVLGQWLRGKQSFLNILFSVAQFMVNLVILFLVNSRLSILTFLLASGLLLINAHRFYRVVYVVSLFTIPLLLNFALLLWEIISLPIFASVMQRVDVSTVTTFNGRKYLWEAGIDWFLTRGQGFFWGNGYRGHYTINLLSDLHEGWDISEKYDLHMHSTSLEFLLSNGLFGTIPLFVLTFLVLRYCKQQYVAKSEDSVLLGVVFYIIIVMQIDKIVYLNNIGFSVLFTIASCVVVNKLNVSKQVPSVSIRSKSRLPA